MRAERNELINRVISYTVKPASFRGCHNATRAKCLLMLRYSATAQQQSGWLTARQLSLLTGLSYGSILASVGKWVRWRQVKRDRALLYDGGLWVYMYSVAPKGRAWLERHRHHMPLERYDAEMMAATGKGASL